MKEFSFGEELNFDSVNAMAAAVTSEKIDIKKRLFAMEGIRKWSSNEKKEDLAIQEELLGFVDFFYGMKDQHDPEKYYSRFQEVRNPARFATIFNGEKETVQDCFKNFVIDRCIRSVAQEIFDENFGLLVPLKMEDYVDIQKLESAETILKNRLNALSEKIKQSGTYSDMEQFKLFVNKYNSAAQNVCKALENKEKVKNPKEMQIGL
jgi:hypothetical protein